MLTLRYLLLLLVLIVAASRCGRGPKLGAQLQAAGGAAAIKKECAGFLRVHEQTAGQQYAWMPHETNFPPAIASFQPQVICIERQDGVLMVDVRLTGGFYHHELLVAPAPTTPGFQPSRGNWSMWQLADGVWEYRE